MAHAKDFKSSVIYQIYPRSFMDSNGDGMGDIRGIISKLDYLNDLGVDIIWMSPAYKSPQDDNGYDISDYQDIDPLFGSLSDVDELIAGLHSRGMKLMMDLVVNHSSDEHPWFIESRSSKDSPKRDWYWWRKETNSWRSVFSGSAWEYDPATDESYLHIFSRKQPDLNWENPEVRQAVYAMMRWWLDRGVDGFRMDVINLISKPIPLPVGQIEDDSFGVANGPRIHEYMQEMHREVLAGRDVVTVGECPGVTPEIAQLYTGTDRNELNMVFTFEHVNLDQLPGKSKWDLAPFKLVDLKANLAQWQLGLMNKGWNSLYFCNHDQPRALSRWGNDGVHRVKSAKAMATVLHFLSGTPYVYQGEEIGMTNADFTEIEQYEDLETLNHYKEARAAGTPHESLMRSFKVKGRDNARTPIQWSDAPNAGFTTGTPWLGVNSNYKQINATQAVSDPDSVFHHYKKIIALRHELPIVAHGDFTLLLPDHSQVFAYKRTYEGKTLTVLVNFSNDEVELADFALHGEVFVGAAPTVTGSGLSLKPWDFVVTLA